MLTWLHGSSLPATRQHPLHNQSAANASPQAETRKVMLHQTKAPRDTASQRQVNHVISSVWAGLSQLVKCSCMGKDRMEARRGLTVDWEEGKEAGVGLVERGLARVEEMKAGCTGYVAQNQMALIAFNCVDSS